MKQDIMTEYSGFEHWFKNHGSKKVLLVCGRSLRYMESLDQYLGEIRKRGVQIFRFQDFHPNPSYESVVKGVELFRINSCDSILAVGGGSAMDVAKCIKAYASMEGNGENGSFLKKDIVPNSIPFLAVPTTAGTGSEATRYAVIYYDNKKQSVTSESMIPGTVFMNPDLLKTLPAYQRKSTMMDALCHAMESFWSVNSTDESRECSREAIRSILFYMDGYLSNTKEGNAGMLRAAHVAGKAINITQTTAGHAMCYKITSIFGCAHGHAAILCDRVLYPWMIENVDRCTDPRGEGFLRTVLDDIGQAMGCRDAKKGAEKLERIFYSLDFEIPKASNEQYQELKTSVNAIRLENHPISLDEETIDKLYHRVLR